MSEVIGWDFGYDERACLVIGKVENGIFFIDKIIDESEARIIEGECQVINDQKLLENK